MCKIGDRHLFNIVGTSKNALLSQLWVALITYLLLSYLKFKSRFAWSIYMLCSIIPTNLFARRNLRDWLNAPFPVWRQNTVVHTKVECYNIVKRRGIMREVRVPDYRSDALTQQVLALYNSFKNIHKGEKVHFNLEDVSWVYPLIALPLTSYIYSTGSTYEPGNSSAKSYLETIGFPQGVDSVSAFEQQLHKGKNFVPISILKKEAREQRERLETLFLEMIYRILGNTKGAENAIYYPVAEFVSNIFDHSKKDEGFVFGQLYQNKNFLDMCIVDNGRGLAAAYKEENDVALSDVDAIKQALEGYSTKRDKERGYGIRTSIRVVCDALEGGFVLLSGSAAFLSVDNKKRIVNLPGFYWQGVIIAYRIPKPTHSINITPYIE